MTKCASFTWQRILWVNSCMFTDPDLLKDFEITCKASMSHPACFTVSVCSLLSTHVDSTIYIQVVALQDGTHCYFRRVRTNRRLSVWRCSQKATCQPVCYEVQVVRLTVNTPRGKWQGNAGLQFQIIAIDC